jgi:uncharacterized membrane protein YfcA
MDIWMLTIFLASVLFASYVQSVTGFAMAMILIAVVSTSQAVEITVAAAVVSLLALVNVTLALRGQLHHIEGRLFIWLAVGQVPGVLLGVGLLEVLHTDVRWLLELALGTFIVMGSLFMMVRPEPRTSVSPPWGCVSAGLAGGLVGGLFAASGPIFGWFNYRQPLAVNAIRATLLSGFALTTSTRTLVVGLQGGLTAEVWLLAGMALPLVVLGTWVGRRFHPPLSETGMKRLAFGVLLLMGGWIVVRTVWLL